jgi:mevalonate kinase
MEAINSKSYPSKVLLFGEYSILDGSDAYAVPNFNYSGQWDYGKISDQRLIDWCTFLEKIDDQVISASLNLAKFRYDLTKGLVFRSNIPGGYGLGSSGALTAALYQEYCSDKSKSLQVLKETLSKMESYFHGSSSGTDPLVSYLGKSLHIKQGKMVQIDAENMLSENFYLFNSKIPRTTSALVAKYKARQETDKAFRLITDEIAHLQNQCIQAYRLGVQDTLQTKILKLSEMQWKHLPWLIPEHLHKYWEEGLNTGKRIFKLCGAGGGGFFLVYSDKQIEDSADQFESVLIE